LRSTTVYVFVRTDPPTPLDFRSQVERGRFEPRAADEPGKFCQACGLSVSDTLADARKLCDVIPFFRKLKIAEGHPKPGLVLATGGPTPGHLTWWIPKGARPWDSFNVLKEGA
jgi:glyoxylase-like metal-dependent hydrolase (beta-lactamase superfamily II)